MPFSWKDDTGTHAIGIPTDGGDLNLVPVTAGASVTQLIGRYAAVTINSAIGSIITNNASFNGTVPFTVHNNTVKAGTTVVLSMAGGQTNPVSHCWVSAVADGQFTITFQCLTGNETGAITINFAVKVAAISFPPTP